ncbi:uncharacterized protein PGRI_089970 [Penicillium griseofulvum]|uniref:Fido domain-containing protein n=1 Tax=Penicillium patulum TaxID=5078 RepID=A0A135LRK5_PENPA|nr:uncharacterized protein PGRI_089970 [Penicillium griseofulvum]KXG51604.1 hypothetical protein PGRI_089970 [Penicillium griseofulvum]
MDGAYDYTISAQDFDPDIIFPGIVTLYKPFYRPNSHPYKKASSKSKSSVALPLWCMDPIMIKPARCGYSITLKLCMAIFHGEKIPEDIGETKEGFLELKNHLPRNDIPVNVSAVLRSRHETVRHAKATSCMITQLCLHSEGISEGIILQAHGILTHRVDAETTPWEEYSGVYRTGEVSAALHPFPHHSLMPYKMKAMVCELQSDLKETIAKGTVDPIAIASEYTHIFVNIDPFVDGNGRMCRLVLNSILLQLGSFLACIGEKEEDRALYLEFASNGSALEDIYGDLEEDERPIMHKELGSFIIPHVKKSMGKVMMLL